MIPNTLTPTECKAWAITRRDGIRNINEAIRALQAAKVTHAFAAFQPIAILEEKRWQLCQEIKELEAVRS